MTTIEAALDRMMSHSDAFTVPEKRWTDAEIGKVRSTTGLTVPSELAWALRTYGYVERETELSFRGRFADGSEALGELQILFSSSDRVIQDYENINQDTAYPNRGVSDFLPFGTADGGRSFLLIDGMKHDREAICYWPIAADPIGEGDNARGIAVVARSLAEFIDSLRPSAMA